jgi:hypothetical protein
MPGSPTSWRFSSPRSTGSQTTSARRRDPVPGGHAHVLAQRRPTPGRGPPQRCRRGRTVNPAAVGAPSRVRRVVAGFDGLLGRTVSMRGLALLRVLAGPAVLLHLQPFHGRPALSEARPSCRVGRWLRRGLYRAAARAPRGQGRAARCVTHQPRELPSLPAQAGGGHRRGRRHLDRVSPLRHLLKRTRRFVREIVDLDRRVVTLAAGRTPRPQELSDGNRRPLSGGARDRA